MGKLTRLCFVAALLLPPAEGVAQSRTSSEAQKATQHYQGGWELMRGEAWERAESEFQKAIDLDPKFALAYYALGRAQGQQKKFAAAIISYVKCRDLYMVRAGETFSNQLDANKALDDRILEMNDYLTKVFTGSATERRHMEETVSRMKQARDRNTTLDINLSVPFFVPLALGAAYFRTGQFVDAEREYKTALDANPSSGETHNNLAVLYLVTNRLPLAAAEITAAEKAGFKVNPGLKDELKQKMGK